MNGFDREEKTRRQHWLSNYGTLGTSPKHIDGNSGQKQQASKLMNAAK